LYRFSLFLVKNGILNKKYNLLLKAARDLFWKHGFRRVSVEEICRKAGVSKMTFYRFFSNKLELAKTVFDIAVSDGMKQFRDILSEASSPQEKMKKIIHMKLEGTHDVSREFMEDFYLYPEAGIKTYIDEKTKRSWEEILNDFRHAQQNGLFRKDMKPEFLLYFTQRLGEMYGDERLAGLYESPQELIRELVNFFTYGISAHE